MTCSALIAALGVAALAGCSLPLTPATAPVAVLAWGSIAGEVLSDWKKPAPPVSIHAEAGPSLTIEGLANGWPDSDVGMIEDTAAWLALRGLTPQDVESGKVIMARIGWTGSDSTSRHSVYLPVLRGTQVASEGSLIRVDIGPSGPAVVGATLAPSSGEQGCVYRDLPANVPTVERLNGRWLGSPRMTSVLSCDSLHTEQWQRAAVLWHKEPPPEWPVRRGTPDSLGRPDDAPYLADAGLVFVYRNVSVTGGQGTVSVYVDGQPIGKLRASDCIVVALAPGMHKITTGTGGFWGSLGSPRRELLVLLEVGRSIPVEFFIDDAVNNNLLLGLTNYRTYEERAFRLVQRPMLTSITGCSGVKPLLLRGM